MTNYQQLLNAGMTTELGIQYRVYLDKGWEESRVERITLTEELAREYVSRYNVHREDETGVPAARVVKRSVSDWEPV